MSVTRISSSTPRGRRAPAAGRSSRDELVERVRERRRGRAARRPDRGGVSSPSRLIQTVLSRARAPARHRGTGSRRRGRGARDPRSARRSAPSGRAPACTATSSATTTRSNGTPSRRCEAAISSRSEWRGSRGSSRAAQLRKRLGDFRKRRPVRQRPRQDTALTFGNPVAELVRQPLERSVRTSAYAMR